jgi:hypothetical protein
MTRGSFKKSPAGGTACRVAIIALRWGRRKFYKAERSCSTFLRCSRAHFPGATVGNRQQTLSRRVYLKCHVSALRAFLRIRLVQN